MKMTVYILMVVILGILTGYFLIPSESFHLDSLIDIILTILIFSIGIGLGQNKKMFKELKKVGAKILLLPLGTIAGSLIGGLITGLIIHYSYQYSFAIASGFGWYSLSAVILDKDAGATAATIAFLANVFRELLAFILIPILAKKLSPYTAISVGGATSMDTTLQLITQSSNKQYAMISFIHGAFLSMLVPLLVPFFIHI